MYKTCILTTGVKKSDIIKKIIWSDKNILRIVPNAKVFWCVYEECYLNILFNLYEFLIKINKNAIVFHFQLFHSKDWLIINVVNALTSY